MGGRSTLKRVVGFVLAAMLRNVCELDMYDAEENDAAEGDGGALGGKGRTEASSSASRMLVGDHVDSSATEDDLLSDLLSLSASSSVLVEGLYSVDSSSSLRDMALMVSVGLKFVLAVSLDFVCKEGSGGGGAELMVTRAAAAALDGADGARLRPLTVPLEGKLGAEPSLSETLLVLLPTIFRWNQLMIGLLALRVIFFDGSELLPPPLVAAARCLL
jgi:hypothetical protein